MISGMTISRVFVIRTGNVRSEVVPQCKGREGGVVPILNIRIKLSSNFIKISKDSHRLFLTPKHCSGGTVFLVCKQSLTFMSEVKYTKCQILCKMCLVNQRICQDSLFIIVLIQYFQLKLLVSYQRISVDNRSRPWVGR